MKQITILLFLLLLPLAIATTTIQTDKTTYILGEEVAISGACSSPNLAVGLRVVLGGNNVWIDQVNSDMKQAIQSNQSL